jgi:hypothetical protein|tara:strand:+ start:99 stop:446 length:348 start_codon:yes stop_codon:yes gene_type:complete
MSSLFYAQLNSENICISITEYNQPLDNVPSTYITIDSLDLSFIGRTWDGTDWEAVSAPTDAETARDWRDQELMASDFIVPLTDHPQHAAHMTYRAALRNWPSTADFPDTKPELSG